MSKKGSIKMLYKNDQMSIKNGKKEVNEEYLIHGEKGLKIKFYRQVDDKKEKVTILSKDDKFFVKTESNGKVQEEILSKDELLKKVEKNKDLSFAIEHLKTMKGGKRKGSKKPSKKQSKKSSKRRGSKK